MEERDRLQPYAKNPFYWQYRGQPLLLIGGSIEDNLFQIRDLEAHLDLLASVGGNYVRCTMSSRDPGDLWPFWRDPQTGRYDLERPEGEHWERFERFLNLTAERGIVAQFELWDRFDFAGAPWQDNPYNPKNNVNYSAQESGLKESIETHPGRRESAFFRTVPALEDNRLVLRYQHLQVDKMLSISLRYGHVLYCMDNETNESPEWGRYWAEYVRRRAREAGVGVELTEMWDDHDLLGEQHGHTLDHPDLYTFVDVSQNNHQVGFEHWSKAQALRQRIVESGRLRPINSVKIYGANTGRFGTSRDGQERFWRNVFGGLATSRFHRPPSGLGLSEVAQAHLRSMRLLTEAIDLFRCEPHLELLAERSRNEAYCTANPGEAYAVFFPDGGNVLLDVSAVSTAGGRGVTVRWLDIRGCRWTGEPAPAEPEGTRLRLVTPEEDGYWA
ncbi:MAG: hypothetical protein ACRDI2_10145, partial [Chloroflexota bacterium]